MKLAVIGGGGVRSPFLAKSLVKNAKEINVDEIVFMDNSSEKLSLFGKLSQKIAQAIDPDIRFTITTDMVEAVRDASFVITTIRSGGDESRVFDERTALNLGILGQETTGAGGFAMALRSIPVLTDLCEKIVRYSARDVLVFNFTNPAGLVTQALRNAGYNFVYGICDAPSGFEKQLVKLLGASEDEFEMRCFGLNHLSWYRDFRLRGEDVYDAIMSKKNLFQDADMRYFDRRIVNLIGNRDLPNEYLYFYYYRDQAVQAILASNETRGETILEINKDMLAAMHRVDIDASPEEAYDIFIRHYFERENQYFAIESGVKRKAPPIPTFREFLAQPDDGGYAGVAIKFIKAYVSGNPVHMVLSVPNNGAISFLNDDDVVEITCNIEMGKVTPIPVSSVDDYQKQLIETVKYFERNCVKAIQTKDKSLAVKALMLHPQVNSYPLAEKLLALYLEHYKEYVGEWKD